MSGGTLAPSTGEITPAPALRMNVLGIKAGDHVLVRSAAVGWKSALVLMPGEWVVTCNAAGEPLNVTWKEIAGVFADGLHPRDREALALNMAAIEKRGDDQIAQARKAKADGLRVMMEGAELARAAAFIPGV